MKGLLQICFLFLFASCASTYHYYSPPINNMPYAAKGEAHGTMALGTSGLTFQNSYAINNKDAVMGMVNFVSTEKYRGTEIEGGFMMANKDSAWAKIAVTLGTGWGSNYKLIEGGTLKDFRGNYYRPFAMVTLGTASNKPLLGRWLRGDIAFSIKANYLIYNGFKATTVNGDAREKKFKANNFFVEPFIGVNAGSKRVRFQMGTGVILKKPSDYDKNIAVFPADFNLGVFILIGREHEKVPKKKRTQGDDTHENE